MSRVKKKLNVGVILLITLISIIILILGFSSIFNTAITAGGTSVGTSELPANEYRQLTPSVYKYIPTQDMVFGDYVLKTQYDNNNYVPYCKAITGYDCINISVDKYGCEIKSCKYNTEPIACNIPSNCFACIGIYCKIEGIGGKHGCTQTNWNDYSCRYVDMNARQNQGGYDLTKNSGAGLTWNLYYKGTLIGSQTDFPRNYLSYYDGNRTCNSIVLNDGKVLCGYAGIDYDYDIYRKSYGTIRTGEPSIQFSVSKSQNMLTKINATLDVKDSYIQGDTANIIINVCNDAKHNFKGLYDITFTFDTFVGDLSKSNTYEIDVLQGCNDYNFILSTEKSTEKVTITSKLRLYENIYSGLMVPVEYILGKENENYNILMVSTNDYVYFGNAIFDNKIVTILPKYSDAYVNSLKNDINNLNNQYQAGTITLDQMATELQKLNLTSTDYQKQIDALSLSAKEKSDLLNKLKAQKYNTIVIIITLIVLLVVSWISFIILTKKKKGRK
jgi:hypothetical protein